MDPPVLTGPLLFLNLPVEIQLEIIELVDRRDCEDDRRSCSMANLRLLVISLHTVNAYQTHIFDQYLQRTGVPLRTCVLPEPCRENLRSKEG